jgi:hypothetical protein
MQQADQVNGALFFGQSDRRIEANILDGELIVINLENGYYYSSPGIGAVIWEAATLGCSSAQIACHIEQHYDAGPSSIADEVSAFLSKLVAEGLLTLAAPSADAAPDIKKTECLRHAPSTYVSPVLTKFDDLVEAFAVDPPLVIRQR